MDIYNKQMKYYNELLESYGDKELTKDDIKNIIAALAERGIDYYKDIAKTNNPYNDDNEDKIKEIAISLIRDDARKAFISLKKSKDAANWVNNAANGSKNYTYYDHSKHQWVEKINGAVTTPMKDIQATL